MTIGNRFELIDGQTFVGQECLNVYFYQQTAGVFGAAAQDLAAAWEINVLPTVRAIQTDDVNHDATACRNLDNPADFTVLPHVPGLAGTVTGEALPPYAAWTFQQTRQTMASRHGWKRIVAVPEAWQAQGIADTGVLATLAAYASWLHSDILGPGGNVYRPVIMRRLLDAQGHLIGYQEFPIATALYKHLGTQNTRKFGRGS